MKVTILDATEHPCDMIALAAGTSYGKNDTSPNRVKNIIKAGHLSCTEFANIHFKIEGISRNCLAQLTRHRLMSFCVESQRYNKYNFDGSFDDYFVCPPDVWNSESDKNDIDNDTLFWYEDALQRAVSEYNRMIEKGIKPEDARYILPGAMKTNLSCAMNLREFYSFLKLRLDSHAQWEIRELAKKMKGEVANINEEWRTLMDYYNQYIDAKE